MKRLTARGPVFVAALVAIFVALGGTAYAMSSSTPKVLPVKANVNHPVHKLKLAAVKAQATPVDPQVKPASFTG